MAPESAQTRGQQYGRSGVYGAWTFLRDVTPLFADWPVRIVLSAIFLFHGFDKLTGAEGVEGFATMMDLSLGLAWLVVIGEIAAGAAVLLGGLNLPLAGLATRLAGLTMTGIMIGAIYKVHWDRWSFTATDEFPMGGMEFQLFIAGLGLWLFLTGGRYVANDGSGESQ